jgi:hypothetical protein
MREADGRGQSPTVDPTDRELARRRWIPADALLHPLALGAVLLLFVNDHFLKAAWPGFVTGKLSDFAGLAFFPLVLLGGWEVVLAAVGRWRGPRPVPLAVAIAATAVVFVLVKTTDPGATAFGLVISGWQWLIASAVGLWSGSAVAMNGPAPVARDLTDLLALPALFVSAWIGRRRLEPRP